MKILELEVRDWGPHRHLCIDMDDPVVGIIGSNGSGKSNVLQALNYALTGNLNKRNGQSYIRNYGSEDGAEKASVRVKFVAGDKEGSIYREIGAKSSKRELVWDGVTYRKDADVKRLMREIVGADDAALANAVFILQGTTADLVKGTPAERNDIFRKLMNLNFVDARANDLLSKASALRAGMADYSEVLSSLKGRLATVKEEKESMEATASALKPVVEALDKVNRLRSGIAEAARMQEEINWSSGQMARHKERAAEILNELGMPGAGSEDVLESIAGDEDALARVDAEIGVWESVRNRTAAADAALAAAGKAMDDLAHVRDECGNASSDHASVLRQREENLGRILKIMSMIVDERAVLKDLGQKCMELSARVDLGNEALEGLRAAAPVAEDIAKGVQQASMRASVAKLKIRSLDSGVTETCPCCGGPLVINETRLQLTEAVQEAAEEKRRLEKAKADSDRAIADAEHSLAVLSEEQRLVCEKKDGVEAHIKQLAEHLDTESDGLYTPDDIDTARMAHNGLLESIAETDSRIARIRNAEAVAANAKAALESAKAALAAVGDLPSRTEQELRAEHDRLHTKVARIKALAGQLRAEEQAILQCAEKNNSLGIAIEVEDAVTEELYNDGLVVAAKEAFTTASDGQEHWEECRDRGVNVADSYWGAVAAWIESRRGMLLGILDRLDKHRAEEDSIVDKIADYEDKAHKNALRKKTADDLDTIRAVIGKNGAPLLYMNSVFASVSSIVQDLLSRMGSNFTVEPDPSQPVTFTFKRTDNDSGFVMAQEQLSGGQAIRLALAMLIAAQQVILPEVGLLVLDEPSSHIDTDGVENMRDMFRNMSGFLESAGMQLVIVDHNEVLAGAFGKTVNLASS